MKTYDLNFTCFEVTEPDGGGMQSNHVAYFSSRTEAEQFVKNSDRGWPKYIREKTINHNYIVLDRAEEFGQLKRENLKQCALSKLSKEEISALGL